MVSESIEVESVVYMSSHIEVMICKCHWLPCNIQCRDSYCNEHPEISRSKNRNPGYKLPSKSTGSPCSWDRNPSTDLLGLLISCGGQREATYSISIHLQIILSKIYLGKSYKTKEKIYLDTVFWPTLGVGKVAYSKELLSAGVTVWWSTSAKPVLVCAMCTLVSWTALQTSGCLAVLFTFIYLYNV